MTAPLTPEEIRKRMAVLRANPELVRAARAEAHLRKERVNQVSVRIGAIEWPRVSEPPPPSAFGGAVRRLPVARYMLSESAWLAVRQLGEKA